MFSESLKKILSLTEQTGDSIIIYNETEPEKAQVILNFRKYEELVLASNSKQELNLTSKNNLTSEELADKINDDISTWKNQEQAQYLAEESKNNNPWAIPPQVKKGAEEVK